MSGPPTLDLRGKILETGESDYAVDGFHHRYSAGADQVVAIAEAFRASGYFLEMLTCEDRRADLHKMRLVYTFNRFATADRHLVLVELAPEIPGAEAPSIAHVLPAADWYEREVFDMYGVRFSGHPNLKRILLPDDVDFHALLKDFGRIEDAPDAAQPNSESPRDTSE